MGGGGGVEERGRKVADNCGQGSIRCSYSTKGCKTGCERGKEELLENRQKPREEPVG